MHQTLDKAFRGFSPACVHQDINRSCLIIQTKLVLVCMRMFGSKFMKEFFTLSPRCNVFSSLVMQTEREPHVDHYRWTFALAMLFTLFMTWFPYIDFRNSEWFSACNLWKCVRAYHDMSIFT